MEYGIGVCVILLILGVFCYIIRQKTGMYSACLSELEGSLAKAQQEKEKLEGLLEASEEQVVSLEQKVLDLDECIRNIQQAERGSI